MAKHDKQNKSEAPWLRKGMILAPDSVTILQPQEGDRVTANITATGTAEPLSPSCTLSAVLTDTVSGNTIEGTPLTRTVSTGSQFWTFDFTGVPTNVGHILSVYIVDPGSASRSINLLSPISDIEIEDVMISPDPLVSEAEQRTVKRVEAAGSVIPVSARVSAVLTLRNSTTGAIEGRRRGVPAIQPGPRWRFRFNGVPLSGTFEHILTVFIVSGGQASRRQKVKVN